MAEVKDESTSSTRKQNAPATSWGTEAAVAQEVEQIVYWQKTDQKVVDLITASSILHVKVSLDERYWTLIVLGGFNNNMWMCVYDFLMCRMALLEMPPGVTVCEWVNSDL